MEKRDLRPKHEKKLKKIGTKIKQLRKKTGMGYEKFGFSCGLHRATYWDLENGSNFQMRTLMLDLDKHGITIEEFFRGL